MAKFSLHAAIANRFYGTLSHFTLDFDTVKLVREMEIFADNLQRISTFVMEQYGQEIRQQIVARFVATQKYRKPKRRTNSIRQAIDQHAVVQSRAKGNEYVELRVGNMLQAPIYTRVQEEGHKQAFQFWQKFQRVRGYPSAPRYPFRASFRLLSHTKQWFSSHPNVKPYLIRVRNPGIRPRGFIKRGEEFINSTIESKLRKIINEAGIK